MAIACFSRTLPGYKRVANNVNNSLGIKVDDKILSTVVYEYAAKKGLSEAADAFKPEYIDELQDYLDNAFCVNRYVNLDDEDGNRMYEDWYLKNTTGNGIVDISDYTEEQLADLDDVTTGAAKKIDATHMVVPMPESYKGGKEKSQRSNKTLKDIYYTIVDWAKEVESKGGFANIGQINRDFGTNIGFNPNTKEFTTRNPKIHGVSIYNPNDTQIEAKRRIDRAQLLNYLANKFNLKIQEISPEEYAKKAGRFSNCCIIGNTVYIKNGKEYTNEQIIEEFLHPAIHALYASNRELVDNLLTEAKRLFPDLANQIEIAYKGQDESVREEELITQVLSKYLNKEISDNGTDTRTIVDYIKQLFEKIAELFQDLFGSPRVQNGTRVEMSGADIRDAYSFENLAELINSKEIEFTDVLPVGEIRKNATNIEFIESSGDYPQRTKENADWSDVTLSFAADFNTKGEKATKRYAGNKFVPVKMFFGSPEVEAEFINPGSEFLDAERILEDLKKQGLPTKNIKLNIAGNGIYSFKKGIRHLTQEEFNNYVTKVLQELQALGITIAEVRSGGQTGADEAGIIAAQRLGIKSSVNAPAGWKFRDASGEDISSEAKFKERFIDKQGPVSKTSVSVSKIGDKTETPNITIAGDSKKLLAMQAGWRKENPTGIVAYRVNTKTFNTPQAVNQGIIGNPFDWQKHGVEESCQMFMDWLTTGNSFGEEKANVAFRNAIIEKILSSKKGTKILYYKELGQPSHATVIDYLINHKSLLKQKSSSAAKEYQPNMQVEPVKKSFEQQVEEIKKALASASKKVVPDENFSKNHTYYIIGEDGKRHKADVSVTGFRQFLEGTKKPSKSSAATVIGTSFDHMVRDYFSTGKLLGYYPNISISQKRALREEFGHLKQLFDKNFKEGYVVITNEDLLRLGGYITKDGKTISVAGTMDMVIVAKNGDKSDIYIYDVKTSKNSDITGDVLVKYTDQVNFYKKLFEVNSPQLANSIAGIGLVVANTIYGSDGSNQFGDYSIAEDGETILYDDKPIEGTENEITIHLRGEIDKSSGTIQQLNASDYIDTENFDFEGLTEEEQEAMAGLGEDSKSLFLKAAKEIKDKSGGDEIDYSTDGKYKKLSENIPIVDGSSPMTEREKVFFGKSIIRYISIIADDLSTDIDKKIAIFGSKQDENSYDDDFFIGKRNTLMTQDVFNAIKNYLVEKTDFFNINGIEDEAIQNKLIWAAQNIDALINSAYADLLDTERVSISSTGEIISESVAAETLEAYELAEQAAEERAAYSIDSREQSYIGSMSTEFKRALNKIFNYEYDENGQIATDENGDDRFVEDEWGYGIPTFVPRNVVINKLFQTCYGLGDSRQMLNAIKEEASASPWMNQVYNIISNSETLTRQLFTVFRKDKNNYGKVYLDDSERRAPKLIPQPFDTSDKVKAQMQRVTKNVNSGRLPLFVKSGKENTFTVDSDFLEELTLNEGKHIGAFSAISSGATRKEKAKAVQRLLSQLGFEDINAIQLGSKNAKTILSDTVDALTSIKKKLEKLSSIGKPFSFQKELNNLYSRLINVLSPILDEETELSAHDNKKNYSVYSDPTAMCTIIDRLAGRATVPYLDNDELPDKTALYEKLFEDKYDRQDLWQFGYGEGSGRTYFCDWLRIVKENRSGERDILSHHISTSVQLGKKAKEYLKQNGLEYTMGVLMQYASPAFTFNGKTKVYVGGRKDVARYRIPTMSDKPANEYIQFLKYQARLNEDGFGLDEMKEKIAAKAFEYVRFEIRRMQELVNQLRNGNPADDVENFSIPRNERYSSVATGGEITLKHLVADGKMIASSKEENSGLMFEFLPMLNDELINGSEYGQLIIDAINGDETDLSNLEDGFYDIFSKATNIEVDNLRTFLKQHNGYKFLIDSIDEITDEEQADAFLTEFIWNDTLAAMNIFNLTVVDPAFHKNSSDLQKRFAEFHSSTQRPNLLAEFVDVDDSRKRKKVSDGKLRYVILEDAYADSSIADEVSSIFIEASKSAPNKARAAELKAMASLVKKEFKNIILTDGQGLGSPTGFWKKLMMLGDDNPQLFEAIQRLRSASPNEIGLSDLQVCIQAFKPFVFSQKEQNFGDGKMLTPTQIKDSEAMIYLAGAIMKGAGKTGLLPALYNIMEDSHYHGDMKNGSYSDDGIDMFVFHSAVKTGATRIINLNGISPEKIEQTLRDTLYGADGTYTEYVQSVSFEDWGKQQEVPAHLQDNDQGMPSQGRVLSVSDLDDRSAFHIPGNKSATKKEFLDRYFDLHRRVFEKSIEIAKKRLGLDTNDELKSNKKLSEILVNSIAKDSRYSIELRKAFTLVNGKFVVPIGDPSLGDKVYGAVLSLLKKTINDEKYLGGPTVIRSSVGFDEELKFFKDKDGGYTAEVYASFLSTDMEEAMTYNKDRHGKIKGLSGYKEGEIISVEDGLKYKLITEDDIIGIADRIPTENKYSQIRYRIKEFLPRFGGEYFVFPKEKTLLGGDDFDIDKVYPRRKYRINYNLQEKVARGEMTLQEMKDIVEIQEWKNEIFDMQWQALGHKSSLEKLFKKGSFQPLKDIAADINPEFGHENHPMVWFSSQRFYQKANAAGKEFVGISALNNTAHALCEMAGVTFKVDFPSFKLDGVHSDALIDKATGEYMFDMMYSPFDGSLISESICMFVGASADNAKDAVLGALNTNPVTGNIFMGLLRMGIPLKTAVYMMNMPAIKQMTEIAEYSGKRLEEIIESPEYAKMVLGEEYLGETYSTLEKGIRTSDILGRAKANDNKFNETDIAVYQLIRDLVPFCKAIRAVTDRTSVNSTKNAAHKSGYDAMSRKLRAEEFLNGNFPEAKILGDAAFHIYDKISYLGDLSSVNTELIPQIFKNLSPLFKTEFKNDEGTGVLDFMLRSGYSAIDMNEKTLSQILNAWLVYKATKLGIIDASEKSRRDRIYKFPISDFLAIQDAVSSNMFIRNLEVGNMSSKYPVKSIKFRSTKFTRDVKDDIAASFAELSDNKDAREFLDDYMDYMISRFGFTFSPQSSMPITPNIEKIRYKATDTLIPYTQLFGQEIQRADMLSTITDFATQFARNNIYCPIWYENNELVVEDDGSVVLDDMQLEAFKATGKVGIRIGKRLFLDAKKMDKDGNHIFTRVSRLGVPNQFLEYDAQEDAYEIETVITSDNNAGQNKAYADLFKELESPEEDGGDADEGENRGDTDVNNEDEGTGYFTTDWFEKLRGQKNFKSLIEELGIDDSFFNAASENAFYSAVNKLYKKGQNLNKSKYNSILDKLNKELCR